MTTDFVAHEKLHSEDLNSDINLWKQVLKYFHWHYIHYYHYDGCLVDVTSESSLFLTEDTSWQLISSLTSVWKDMFWHVILLPLFDYLTTLKYAGATESAVIMFKIIKLSTCQQKKWFRLTSNLAKLTKAILMAAGSWGNKPLLMFQGLSH